MPRRMNKICQAPGCSELCDGAYCDTHKRVTRKYENRESAHKRGYNSRWRKARLTFLSKHPLCRHCEEAGVTKLAEVVDHIIPHKGSTELFWDKENWQPLCKRCHDIKTATEDGGFGNKGTLNYPYWVSRPIIPLTVVCGTIASGKTTFVRENAKEDELIIDLDYIISEMSGLPVHEADMNLWGNKALQKRNEILDSLSRRSKYKKAWLVATSAYQWQREYWRDRYGAKVIVLETEESVCIERLKERKLSDRKYSEQCEKIKKWWEIYKGVDTNADTM